MKRILFILAVMVTTLAASADDYTYLNFVNADGATGTSVTTPLKITFNGTNAIVTAGGETTTLAMPGYAYLEFSNTDLGGGGGGAIFGDVNGDGAVDVTDVNCAINVMLGNADNATYDGRADVNGDGTVDVTDINLIINVMLGN